MKRIVRLAAAACAAVLSAYAWADITIDNVTALSGLSASGGSYARVQFQLDDQRFTVTGPEALGDVVWVKSIGVVQRPDNTIAANSTLRIQQSTGMDASTGISNAPNAAVIAISQPLSASSTATLTVGNASQTLRTYTFAAPFPLKKSTLYTASFYNASGTAANQPLAMYQDETSGTTQNTNTTIHASQDANFSPCVRIIAMERSKIADVGETATWSGLWGDAAPAETDSVGLNVTAANATLTMDTSATVAGLAIVSETAVGPLTFSGTGTLTSTTTSIATDSDVSAIPASLGAVTLASGKTLTVRTLEQVSSLSATTGTLATTGDTALAAGSTLLSSVTNLVVRGGTFTSSLNGGSALATGRNITVTGSGSNLLLAVQDSTGYDAAGPGIRVENGGTLTFGVRDTLKTPITLCGGTLTCGESAAESGRALDFFNGDGNVVTVEAAESGTVEAPTTSSITVAGTEDNAKLAIRAGTLTFAVAERAKLVVSGTLYSQYDAGGTPGAVTKSGEGVLELTAANTFDKGLTISGGRVLVTGDGALGSGAVTVNEGKALEVQVADAATKTIANALSGAGTVKKSGAGTLSLTGTVSTPVEVAAGTLDIGANRPSLSALASDATLKLTATTAEVTAGDVVLPTTLEVAPDKARFSVVNGSGEALAVNSVSVANGLLTLALPVSEPTFTVTDGSEGAWAGATAWPTSGNVTISANQLTADKTVTIPAPAEGTRALTQVTVVGNTTAKVTLVVESGVTIATLVPYGYVRVDVATVNALTNAPVVSEGATLEVIAESAATLSKAISGAGTFAKGGAGVLTLGANITTTSGSIVQSGELKFSANGYINASSNTYADATGDVLVKSGATLNLAGRGSSGGLLLREVTLEANATFKNETSNIGTNDRQLQKLTLLGNATVVAGANFGLLANGYGATTLTLNGYTLRKQGSGNFWLMNSTVNGASGKIVVEAGSVTNTGANKAVTFSTPITLESTLTGTPFNLTGADVTASDNLTANGPVSFAKLITVSGKTIAGTGTVTVTDMTLGGPLNVTGNLVIDRATVTETRSFANAIKVASSGSLTTKGKITWSADSNEFLGSLTVASGTLSIKTPNQKLGGNITIAHGATLTHTVKTAESDKLDFTKAATIKVYGTLDMCKQRWTMRTHNKLYVYPGATVTGSGDATYGAFDAEGGQANTISFCAADANSGSGEITFASNLRARANWTLDVAEGVTVNLTGVRAQTTGNGGTGDYKDNAQIAKTGAGKLIVGSDFRLNGPCEGTIEVAAEKILTLSGTVAHTAAFSGAGKILVTNDVTSTGTPASSVTLNGTLGTVTGEGSSAPASCAMALEVASGSTLTLNNTVPTTLSTAIAGGGNVVIGDGTAAAAVTLAATDNDAALTVAENASLNVETGAPPETIVNETPKSIADGKTVTNNGTLTLTSGYGYFNIAGTGKTVVPGSDFLFGIGRANGTAPFSNGLEIPASANFRLRPWNEASLRTIVVVGSAEVKGSITKDGGNSTVALQIPSGATIKGTGTVSVPVSFENGGSLDVSLGVLGISEVSGTVTLVGYTATVQPVLNTASEVTFAEISGYTLPKSGVCYWLVKDTAKVLSAVAPASEDAIRWSALPWKSSDDMAVSPEIFALGLDLTANVSASAASTPYIGLNVADLDFSKTALTLSGSTLFVLYEGGDTTPANFKSLTVTGVAAVEIAALNNVEGEVLITGTLCPLDSQYIFQNVSEATTLGKALTGTGTVAVLADRAVTMSSALGSTTNDLATFTGNLQVGRGATLTLTSTIKQEISGDIAIADETSRLVIGNGSQASGLVLKGRFLTGQTASTLGGTLTISANSYFTFASSSAATVTGAVTGTGRLTIGDGSQASALTLTGQLGSVQSPRMDESADRCIYNGAIVVESGSTLTVAPTVQTLLAKSVMGSGKLVVGNGTTAQTVGLSAANTVSTVEVMPQATLELSAGNASVLILPAASTVTVAEGATLELSTGKLAATVSGEGEVSVPTGGDFTYLYPAGATNVLGAAKVSIASSVMFTLAAEREDVTLGVDLLVVNGTLVGSTTEGVKTGPKVSVAADKSLGGIGSIEMPVELAEGAILDGTYATTGAALACVKTVSLSSVKVKADKLAVLLTCPTPTPVWQVENFALQAGAPEGAKVVLNENAFTKTMSVAISIPPTLPADPAKLPEAVAGNDQIVAAIKEKAEACLTFAPISEIASVTVKNSADKVVSADGAALFTGLEAAVEVVPGDRKTDGSYTATATVTYDFGVSQITVKKAQLTDDTAPQNYVLACAKVSNGKSEEATAAGYATGTTVSLLLDGTEAADAVALDTTTLSNKFGVTAGLGERWFAVPMGTLFPVDPETNKATLGTKSLTVRASNSTQSSQTP